MLDMSAYIKKLLWLALMFFVCILAAGFICVWVNDLVESPYARLLISSAVQGVVGFVGAGWLAVRRYDRCPFRCMGLTSAVSWRPFLGVVIVYILGLPMLNWIVSVNESISFPAWMGGLEGQLRAWEEAARAKTEEMLAVADVYGLIVNILVIGVLTGFCEEVFFRGVTQRMIGETPILHGAGAVWVAAIIFSAAHFQFFGFIPRMLLGLFFGYLLLTTGSLWPGIFAHALNNSLVVLSVWFERRGDAFGFLQTWGVPEKGHFPWLAIFSALVLATFFLYCYNWFFRPANSTQSPSLGNTDYGKEK